MPTYEYRCKTCGQHLEVVQSFRDDPLTECPQCSGDLKKVIQPIGIAFKGSGFYRNDSRAGGGSKAPAGTKANGSSGADGASSSESAGSDSSSGGAKSRTESRKETTTAGSEAKSA
jgi:putative FmdB family regulatory protein